MTQPIGNPLTTALNSLQATRHLHGCSDTNLADDIIASIFKNTAVSPKKISAVPALNSSYNCRAIDALLSLAQSSSMTHSGIVGYYQSSWSILKYLGMFASVTKTFNGTHSTWHSISQLGQTVVGSQRRVFSEELGIAFGILVGEEWCRIPAANAVVIAHDIDLVLRNGTHAANGVKYTVANPTQRHPDYMLQIHDPATSNILGFRILECKGSKSNSRSKRQIESALGQLNSVTVNGQSLPGLAVATYTGQGPWGYLALDPEETAVEVEVTAAVARLAQQPGGPESVGEYDTDGVWRSENPESLAAASLNASMAGLASFCGNLEVVRRLSAAPDSQLDSIVSLQARPGPVGEVSVSAQRFSLGNNAFDLYRGADAEVYSSLLETDPRQILAAQASLSRRIALQQPREVEGAWSTSRTGAVIGIVPV